MRKVGCHNGAVEKWAPTILPEGKLNGGRPVCPPRPYTFAAGTYTNSYTYDAASNWTSLTAPDGSVSTYGYDTLNRLNGLANSWAGSFGFSYDALSRRTQLTRPNGVNTNYNYDSLSHLLSVLHQAGANTLDGASYTYDPAGNRTAKTNYLNATTSNYTYDPLYELTQVTQGSSTTESYSYDAVGNRLSSLGVPTYSYNTSNELTSDSLGSYTYDANGNTLTDAQGRSYSWDFENRMVQAVVPGSNGGTTTFKYDPFGRRIQKSGPLGTTNYLYDGATIAEEVDQNATVLARYTQSDQMDEPLAELRSGTSGYYEGDGASSISSLSNSSGALADTYTYDSFGKVTASTGTLANPFRYTGRESDSETGLYEYRARYYDVSIGRFIGEDPARDGMNFYRYVGNDPIDFTDPLGLAKCFAQLKYRYARFGQNHSFWWVQTRTGQQYIVSGGPTGANGSGSLDIWVDRGSTGTHYPADNSGASTAFSTPCEESSSVCDGVDNLLKAANTYPNNTIDYGWFGPNGNSIAHYLGQAGGFDPPQPPKTPYWNTPIPFGHH